MPTRERSCNPDQAELAAFGGVYDALSPVAYGLALRIVGPELAGQVLVDAFVLLWKTGWKTEAQAELRERLLNIVLPMAIDGLPRGAAALPERAPGRLAKSPIS